MVKLYLCYQDDGGFVLQSKHRLLLDMQIVCQRAIVSNIRENSSLTPNNVNTRAKLKRLARRADSLYYRCLPIQAFTCTRQ